MPSDKYTRPFVPKLSISTRLRIEREQIFGVLDEEARAGARAAPIADAARRRAAVRVRAGLERRLDPERLAGARIERLDGADAVRRVQRVADLERSAAELLGGAHLRRLCEDARVERWPAPRDAQARRRLSSRSI
jgi:hypothetical protein